MKRISNFLLAIFSVLVSCTRDLVPDNDGFAQLDVDFTIITNDSNHFPWGSESPNSAGLTHNDYVGQALEYLKDNPEATILQALQTITSSGITAAEIDSICTRISSKSDIEIESTIVSSLNTSRAIELFYAIDTALFTSTSYNILSNKLDSIQLLVEADLLYHDWDIVMVYLETVNASAYFWYPSSHGGSGNGGL